MAILEINLEKPALIEEYQYPGESDASGSRASAGRSSGGGKGKLVVGLAVLAGIAVLAWKLKSGSDQYESEEYDHGPEPEIGGEEGGVKGKVASVVGLVAGLVGLVAAIQTARR